MNETMKQQVWERNNKQTKPKKIPQHTTPPTPAPPQQKTVQWSVGILSSNCSITPSNMGHMNAICLPNLSESIVHVTTSGPLIWSQRQNTGLLM